MTVTNLGTSLFATGLGYDSTATMFGANESRLALANQVGNEIMFGGGLSPDRMMEVGQMDKALALQGASAQINYEVAQAMFAGSVEERKKQRELKQRLLAAGATFV